MVWSVEGRCASVKFLTFSLDDASQFPDWRWQTPMGELDPKKKNERSRNFGSAYAMANLLKSEGPVDDVIGKLCDWMNQHADEKKPMDLVR